MSSHPSEIDWLAKAQVLLDLVRGENEKDSLRIAAKCMQWAYKQGMQEAVKRASRSTTAAQNACNTFPEASCCANQIRVLREGFLKKDTGIIRQDTESFPDSFPKGEKQ